jgi:endonuclease YncB( thermonuclease family)
MRRLGHWIIALCLLTAPSLSESALIGRATVVDGDTIEIHGERIRLNGIDEVVKSAI